MNEFWHDSPTFLNRGDRFMMGLTLPQLLLVGAIGVVWGMMGMIFEGLGFTTALAWVTAGIGLAFSLVMALVRVSGLRLSYYCALSLLRWRNRPEYWIDGGSLEWDAAGVESGARSGRVRLPGGLTDEQAMEARIASQGLQRGARGVYRSVRDGLRQTISSLIKGPAK